MPRAGCIGGRVPSRVSSATFRWIVTGLNAAAGIAAAPIFSWRKIGLVSRGVEAGYSRADAPGNYRRLRGDLESGDARAVLLAEDLAYGLGILVSLANPRIIVIGGRGAAMG